MQRIFISYSRLDESKARKMYEALIDEGFSPWFDKVSLLPGQVWESEIKKAIKETNFVILLLSNNSINKQGFFHKEIQFVLDVFQSIPPGKIFLIPARLDDCSVPETIQAIQWVDLFPDWEDGFTKICDSLHYERTREIASSPIEELAPLPADVSIIPPADNLPPKLVALHGSWIGRWGNVLPSQLIVEQITNDKAQVIYSWGESPSGAFKEGWQRINAGVSPEGIINWGTETIFTFKIDEKNDVLIGTREVKQRIAKVFMRRKI